MALDSLIRKGVAIANKVTKRLQVKVSHKAWIADAGDNSPSYAAPVLYTAIVERGKRAVRTNTGDEVIPTYIVTFLVPVVANGASGRDEPIDTRDLLILPNGTSGKVLSCPDGVLDPGTDGPYSMVVALG